MNRVFTNVLLLTLLSAGCKSSTSSPAVASTSSSPQTPSSGAPPQLQSSIPSTTASTTLTDPAFPNMVAETLTIPSGWKFDGTMMISPCTTLPWQVFRAYAADGLTEFRQLPTFGWKWSAQPQFQNTSGCMHYSGPMPAADFLSHLVQTITGGVHVIGPSPVNPAFQQWAQHFADQMNAQPVLYAAARATYTADTAALRFETHNGSFIIEQRLRAAVECTLYKNPGPLQGGSCYARADVLRAPQGKLDALIQLVDSNNLPNPIPNPQYAQALLVREQKQDQAALATMQRIQAQGAAMIKQMNDQMMATMQANHAAWQQQQESQFQSFQANQAARSQAMANSTSDWVDFALGQQTVTGPDGTAKLSSNYTYTWSNTTGNTTTWYQTNDPNANPNGTLSGNWSQNTQVHGNGQPF